MRKSIKLSYECPRIEYRYVSTALLCIIRYTMVMAMKSESHREHNLPVTPLSDPITSSRPSLTNTSHADSYKMELG